MLANFNILTYYHYYSFIILCSTINSTLHFVLISTVDDSRTVEKGLLK